jgi:hypothetical protein
MIEQLYNVWDIPNSRCVVIGKSSEFIKEVAQGTCDRFNSLANAMRRRQIGDAINLFEVRPFKPGRVIPSFKLDPTISILQAGHIQDRQRKKYKP